MAIIIPENLPSSSNTSRGEQFIFRVLRDQLPNDFIVWYEPIINDYVPDFVVLGPGLGLLIIEVKGWYPNQIDQIDEHGFHIIHRKQGCPEYKTIESSPLRQAQNYFRKAATKFADYPILQQLSGPHQGKRCFPIGTAAVMSNITQEQAKSRGIDQALDSRQVIYRDEMLTWKNLESHALIQRLKSTFKVWYAHQLNSEQIDTIRGILNKSTVIRKEPATLHDYPDDMDCQRLVVLDYEQEKIARHISSGHHLFSGVAGSGKTLILLSRAKFLANQPQERRILIVCYNITLAAYLRSLLHGDPQNPQYQEKIEVRHFHDWAKSILGKLPPLPQDDSIQLYDEQLGEVLMTKLEQQPHLNRWNTILIDEAHTFSPSWFKCCVAAMKDPENGDLMVVSDGNQSLYKRRKFTWKSVGIKAVGRGRSRYLKHNYRNTQPIITAAWNIVQGIPQQDLIEDPTFPIISPDSVLRDGAMPELSIYRSKREATAQAVEQIRKFVQLGYSPADIAVVYRYLDRDDRGLFQSFLGQIQGYGLPYYWITESDETKRQYTIQRPGVRILTAHSSLGLEFKVVILLWAEQFSDAYHQDPERSAMARRQLYVAMTRAQEALVITASSATPFIIDELRNSQTFVVSEFQQPAALQ